ncbi:9720_t:CDS:1, partial [Acaulospora morrowiae]
WATPHESHRLPSDYHVSHLISFGPQQNSFLFSQAVRPNKTIRIIH